MASRWTTAAAVVTGSVLFASAASAKEPSTPSKDASATQEAAIRAPLPEATRFLELTLTTRDAHGFGNLA